LFSCHCKLILMTLIVITTNCWWMKQFGHSLMGLFCRKSSFQPHSKGLIFLDKYIPFRVPVVNFVRFTNFEDGIQKNHCWTLSGQRLVFSQIWFSETMPVRFFNCCDFITSVNAYWVWLRHFWFCFFHSTLSNLVHPLLKIQQFCWFLFLLLDLSNLQIKPP